MEKPTARAALTVATCLLLQTEDAASDHTPSNRYVNHVRSCSKRTCAEVIDVLAAVDAEVRTAVRCEEVLALVNRSQDCTCGANE